MKMPHLVPITERTRPAHPPVVAGLAGHLIDLFQSMRSHLRTPPQEKQLSLLETLPLGGKRQLMLVRCGKERFLIGSGADSVQTIVKLAQEARGSGLQEAVPARAQSIGDQA